MDISGIGLMLCFFLLLQGKVLDSNAVPLLTGE